LTAQVMEAGGWKVMPLVCVQVGQALKGRDPNYDPHPLADDFYSAVLSEALAASICHSTNWDALHAAVISYVERIGRTQAGDSPISRAVFDAEIGCAITSARTSDFEDQMAERFAIFHGVVESFQHDQFGLTPSDVATLSGDDGLVNRLKDVPGFREDPESKKARVFLQNLVRSRLVEFQDLDVLEPAIEYHLIRLYVRTGRVLPRSESARTSLTGQNIRRIDSVSALRRAVATAMRITADAAGLDVLALNDLEWQIGRSLCVREEARCDGPPLPHKPLAPQLETVDGGCPLRSVCDGYHNVVPKNWEEPRLSDRYSSHY